MNIEKVLLVGIQESYNYLKANELLEEDKLYFCTNTRNLYRGKYLYTDAVRRVINRPTDLKDIAVGKIYYICSTNTLEYYDEGLKKWIVLRPRIVNGVEVEYLKDGNGNIILNDVGKPLEEYVSDEYADTIPTSLAVYNLIKTQIDKNNNSGNIVTGLTAGNNGGQIDIHFGDSSQKNTVLRELLMRPYRVKTVNNRVLAVDDDGVIISRTLPRPPDALPSYEDVIEYQTVDKDTDGSIIWESGFIVEQNVYPVTGSDIPLMSPDVHADPNNPENGFNSEKGRYEFYLTDGSVVYLPLAGKIGDVGAGEDGSSSVQKPNYTEFVNVEGGSTPSATNRTDKSKSKITVYTNVRLSPHPNNSLFIDGYNPEDSREPDFDFSDEDNNPYNGCLVWLDVNGFTHWIDVKESKHYYYKNGVNSSVYSSGDAWIDLNGVRYRISSYDRQLKVYWEDIIYSHNTPDRDIYDDGSDEDNPDVSIEDPEDEDAELEDPEEDLSPDDDPAGDDYINEGDEDDLPEPEPEVPSGTPVNIRHRLQVGLDTRLNTGDNRVCHCFWHDRGESETDSSGRTFMYYYTFNNTNFYKFYSKTIETPTTNADGTPGAVIITFDTNSVEITEPLNPKISSYFSLNRFDFDMDDATDEISYDGSGLMVDLTPYTKLTLFWEKINEVNNNIKALNEKVDAEIKILHDLLKIEEFKTQ